MREAAFIATNSGAVAYAMGPINTGWCARFTAPDTKDIKAVTLSWITVSTPGIVQLRIETVDAATRRPTGALYDANAVYNITPAAGIQTYTFASLPTAGMTAGAEYALVLLTTTAGTTHSLSSYGNPGGQARYPSILLTAADGTVRSNFAEVGNGQPIASIIWEDDTCDALGLLPYYQFSNNNIFGTLGVALKIITSVSHNVAGVAFDAMVKTGTPAGDLRCRIFDSSNNVIFGTTVSIVKESLANVSGRQIYIHFPVIITLPAGTYRVVLDSAASANSSNCFGMRGVKFLSAAAVPANYRLSTCPDIGTPVWTDSTTDIAPAALILDSFPAAAGGIKSAWGSIR